MMSDAIPLEECWRIITQISQVALARSGPHSVVGQTESRGARGIANLPYIADGVKRRGGLGLRLEHGPTPPSFCYCSAIMSANCSAKMSVWQLRLGRQLVPSQPKDSGPIVRRARQLGVMPGKVRRQARRGFSALAQCRG